MKPNPGSDEIVFFARAALKNDGTGDYERDPVSSADLDQQGWDVYTHSIPVISSESDNPESDNPDSDDPVSDSPESDDPAPDLIIGGISWEPAEPYEKDNMTFEVKLVNNGSGPSGSFGVKCFVGGNEVSSDSISGLEAGSNTSFTFDWVPPSSGDLYIKAAADGDNQVPESDEGNNEKVEPFNVKALNTSSPSSSSSSSSSSSKSSSSGGGGGGGGGGAGSPEPASNVEVKELSQEFVTNGNHVKFGFPRNVTCITYVDFDPKRSLGKVTTIVEMLKGVSKVVSMPPSGMVYRNANIWVGNAGTASPENIENAVVGFRVEKNWIASNEVDESEIRLCRYNEEKWGELSTRKIREDSNYVYFEAETPGFSPFSITVPSMEGGVAGSAESAAEGEDIVRGMSGEVSSENDPVVLEASAVEEEGEGEGAGTSGSMTKILLSFVLLSLMILIGFMVSRKQS